MSKKIWKYEFKRPLETFAMPKDAEIINVAIQNDPMPAIWAIVEDSNPMVDRYFAIVGTGHPFEHPASKHIGSVLTSDRRVVWHVFECFKEPVAP